MGKWWTRRMEDEITRQEPNLASVKSKIKMPDTTIIYSYHFKMQGCRIKSQNTH